MANDTTFTRDVDDEYELTVSIDHAMEGGPYIEVCLSSSGEVVYFNKASATQLRDWLTEALADLPDVAE